MKKLLILIVICTLSYGIDAQNKELKTNENTYSLNYLINKFESFAFSIPIEKVYLHFDKSFYYTGEDIWFKAYIVDETFHLMRSVSNILYVELISIDNELIERLTLKITDGYAIGDFSLSNDINQGQYIIRAYTFGMKNFDENFFFYKKINIINIETFDKQDTNYTPKQLANNIDLQFFPEGGYLIEGISSQLAFKAIDYNGKSVNIKGGIYNQDDSIITNIETAYNGIGKINFTPKNNSKYYAKITYPENNSVYNIPNALRKGYVLSIDNIRENNILIDIHTNTPGKTIWIIGQNGGKIYYASQILIDKTSKRLILPKFEFPSGITQFTLFNEDRKPICERLVFIRNNEDQLNISLKTDKKSYTSRDKANITIKTTDIMGIDIESNLSISVTDLYQNNVPDSLDDDIYSYLLLTSELKGNIENPGYYFINNDSTRKILLDNLLLTQGWRRFSWQDAINNDKIYSEYPFEKGIVLDGRIVKCPKRYPVEYNKLVAIFLTEDSRPQIIFPNPDSTFQVNLPHYYGKKPAIFRFLSKSNKSASIKFEFDSLRQDFMMDTNKYNFISTFKLDQSQIEFLKEKRFVDNFYYDDSTEFINEVVITRKKLPSPHKKPETYRLLPEGGLYIDDYIYEYQNVINYLSHFPGVRILKDKWNINTIIRFNKFENNSFMLSTAPLYIIDDIPFEEDVAIRLIESLRPEEVMYINALSGTETSFYGCRGSTGVIVIYTKIPTKTKNISNTGNIHFALNGFYSHREFYSPNYDIPNKEHEKKDLRSTIYWNPNVKTNSNGEANVTYFNTDRHNIVKVKVEGIGHNGFIGVKELFYTVDIKE